MKYVISGKSDSFWLYVKKHHCKLGKDVRHARTLKVFDKITKEDTIVLLYGWWGRSWAKEAIKETLKVYPKINFECLDGPFGDIERKDLKSERISSRFSILDLRLDVK